MRGVTNEFTERLKSAREAAGFENAAGFAYALGVEAPVVPEIAKLAGRSAKVIMRMAEAEGWRSGWFQSRCQPQWNCFRQSNLSSRNREIA